MKVRNALIAGCLAVALVVIGGCGDGQTSESTKVGGPADPTTTLGRPEGTYKVGDVVKLGTAEVTVHSVKDPFDPGNPAVTVPSGTRLLAIDAEVKNVSSNPQDFSGFSQFQMKDSTGKTYDPVPLPRAFPALGGEVEPGASRRGWVAFQIPQDANDLQIVFNNKPSANDPISFTLA